eukprot:CAMPEP_0198317132 /NCGR_PEP_ID=MMETSP1450-20131203/6725_1 /TAXON_ID=753684 ORGANISM="Madagascaria erythrocladiodes, Strain CCMP3234" /NCGR_SAMPLE_ID=MMETSP1450 /ASSEMBLY_ACC=CAM_ASM_001115 /LENGTH=411 /DNA_ID=CAMNT_0044020315 /DNA_START=150 /DNA_END=1385 /DNA_ORIENTATION=+
MKLLLLLLPLLAAAHPAPDAFRQAEDRAAAFHEWRANRQGEAALADAAARQSCYEQFINEYLGQVDNIAQAQDCISYYYRFNEDECCEYVAIAYDVYKEILETCGDFYYYGYTEYILEQVGPVCKGEATRRPTPSPYPTPKPSNDCEGLIQECVASSGVDGSCLTEEPSYDCCGAYYIGSGCAYEIGYRYTCSDIDPYDLAYMYDNLYYSVVRCDLPPPPEPSPDIIETIAECYPGSATVEIRDGGVKRMADLQLGDAVKTSDGQFSDVFFFSHRKTDGRNEYIRLASDDTDDVLEVSAGHLVYANGKLTPASKVAVGDSLNRGDGSRVRVSMIEKVVADGMYHPHTMQGDVVVNGFRTSGYTTAVAPQLAHVALAPLRVMYMMGVKVPQFLNQDAPKALFTVLPSGSTAE